MSDSDTNVNHPIHYTSHPSGIEAIQITEHMSDRAEKGSEMSEWISTTDRLPDDDATVLIAMDDGEVWTGYLEADQWRYVSGEPITSARITCWMDFPDPPDEVAA